MSIENARQHLSKWNREEDIIEFQQSSATVSLAAEALGVEEARIAKTLSFKNGEKAFLVVTAGDMRIDNQKFKKEFGIKAKFLNPQEVEQMIGHAIGGVCPFGTHPDVAVYLDVSLQRFTTVFPACGSSHSAIEMSCQQLEVTSGYSRWVDVCQRK